MSLGERSKSAVHWALLGTLSKYFIQLIVQIILARFLGPQVYGLFALGMLVMLFSNFLADFGLAWGLVQKKEVTEEDIRFAMTWQFVLGTVVAGLLLIFSEYIALFFKEPQLTVIISWLSLACVFNALSAPSANLLRRDLDFKTLNLLQIASYVIGYVLIGLPMAFFGYGVWALVTAWLMQSFAGMVLQFIRKSHSLKPLFWYSDAKSMMNIGSTVFFTNIVNWFLNNIDRIVLGRLLNTHAVGLYTVSYNLAVMPNGLLLSALQPAFLSIGARLQDEKEKMRTAYLQIVAVIWVLILPCFVIFSAIANDLIHVMYGEKWVGAGVVLSILALAMPFYVMWGMSTPILWNTGKKHLESILQLPIVMIGLLLMIYFADFGIAAFAMVAAFILVLRALVIGYTACHLIGLGIGQLVPIWARGMLISLLVYISIYLVQQVMIAIMVISLVKLIVSVLVGFAILICMALLFPRLIGVSALNLLIRFSPGRLSNYLKAKVATLSSLGID
ncbi:lipopolysaccharide biosynthesis protein [Deefgea piscis]|uniref:lipopolysaccharide biosynthesis protein n=1 Tax=Deefgea piscis TaxID=2739061 RepID=UPI001C81C954|nr:lipopolysaccharide biosynthesis protein [Deefgea piscis]QZA82026.1 lipopolysaccharide biosynthesis protein [Deefgea piscis]